MFLYRISKSSISLYNFNIIWLGLRILIVGEMRVDGGGYEVYREILR